MESLQDLTLPCGGYSDAHNKDISVDSRNSDEGNSQVISVLSEMSEHGDTGWKFSDSF